MSTTEHVLLVTERFPPDIGGLARSGARTAGALSRLAVEVDILAWTRTLPPGALETVPAGEVAAAAAGATLHRLGLFSSWDLSLQHTLNVLEGLHRERNFTVVWGHYLFPAGFFAVLFAELVGIRSTVSARGNDVDQMMFPPGDFARLRWTLERAGAITAVSRDLAGKVQLLLGSDDEIVVVPNAVDTELFCPGPGDGELRAALGIAPDEVVLGFSGELRHKKGMPFLLAALREVRRERPACLLIIGEVRAREHAHLVAFRTNAPEDADRIVVSGRLDEPAQVAHHLRLCDIVLQPSMWDGMPNALLEAMACERVVLASDAGGIPEVVTHDENGFIVPKAHLHRLGGAILELLELPDQHTDRIRRAARARIVDDYHPEREAAALERVLSTLSPRSSA